MRLRSYAADSGQRLAILPGSRPSNFRTVCCLATSHYIYIIIIHITYCASKLHLSRLGHTAYLHLYHAFIASKEVLARRPAPPGIRPFLEINGQYRV